MNMGFAALSKRIGQQPGSAHGGSTRSRSRHQPRSETWQGDSWKVGGGPAWLTGSYDPELNLVYWGIGNPPPIGMGRHAREIIYTPTAWSPLIRIRGALKWYYQFTPHDLHDWDATEIPGADRHGSGGAIPSNYCCRRIATVFFTHSTGLTESSCSPSPLCG